MYTAGEWQSGTVGTSVDKLAAAAIRCSDTDRRSLLPVAASHEPEERRNGAEVECGQRDVRPKTCRTHGGVAGKRLFGYTAIVLRIFFVLKLLIIMSTFIRLQAAMHR